MVKQKVLPPTLNSTPISRKVLVAPHVVADPLADIEPSSVTALDWEATLKYRHYLWSLGLSIAEGMDTAQRGMGLNWKVTKELINKTIKDAQTYNEKVWCGAGTDHLKIHTNINLDNVIKAYEEQCEFVEKEGGQIILMASRALASIAKSSDDYVKVYDYILSQVSEPIILHWLGDMFDPELKGYWGEHDIDKAMEICLNIIKKHSNNINSIKISLLDKEKEIIMRRLLPNNVKMYTGDDFNYPELIQGNGEEYSHALLGIFDAIAPLASAAFAYLDKNNIDRFNEVLKPTVPLSRHIFKDPTQFYKVGIVFLAYLNGHQNHFRMVGGLEGMRSVIHLSEIFVLADKAGLLLDAEKSVKRMEKVLKVSGVSL